MVIYKAAVQLSVGPTVSTVYTLMYASTTAINGSVLCAVSLNFEMKMIEVQTS